MSALWDALQYGAETLSKPGRAVRGLLAGRPEELLNLVPFSDSMGLTDAGAGTTGADLLHQYGIADKDSTLGAIGGFATDILTDPLTYLAPWGAAKAARYLTRARTADEIMASAKNLLPLRREFSVLEKVAPAKFKSAEAAPANLLQTGEYISPRETATSWTGKPLTANISGEMTGIGSGLGAAEGLAARKEVLKELLKQGYEQGLVSQKYGGFYAPKAKAAIVNTTASEPLQTLRHEIGHGMMDAMRSGQGSTGPLTGLSNMLTSSENAALNSLGRLAEEAGVRVMETRGLSMPGKAAKFLDFFKKPIRAYGELTPSPLIRALYEGGYLGRLPEAAAVTAGGAGLGALLTSALSEW